MLNLIQQRVEECFEIAEKHFQRSFKRPEVSFKLRGQKAGVAHIDDNRLRFNPTLYAENRTHFLEHTVAHEVAHLIAYALYGKRIRAHGAQWQGVMQQVYLLPAQRCHSYTVCHTAKTHYLYKCQCQQREPFALSAQRHARINKGMHYICKVCSARLLYINEQIRR
ncbi:MAG: SprT family zinc-dependent metalloprotease [Pseudomonas sp.]|nr:SprT family zinc-dependent metalloprotease [Pseudomonas sp.]